MVKIKSLLKSFIPPAFASLYQFALTRTKNVVYGDFDGWDHALASLPYQFSWTSNAYTSSRDALLKFKRRSLNLSGGLTANQALRLLPLSIVLNSSVEPSTVYDVGGGDGFYFEVVKTLYPSIEWVIVEREELIEKVRDIADDRIKYLSALPGQVRGVVHIAGTLQYLEDPINFLRKVSLTAEHIVIPGVIVSNESRVCIQSVNKLFGESYAHPIRFFQLSEISQALEPMHLVSNLPHPMVLNTVLGKVSGRSLVYSRHPHN